MNKKRPYHTDRALDALLLGEAIKFWLKSAVILGAGILILYWFG